MIAPRATYRVQLHAGFGFDDAAALADYLQELGVSHLYASPYLQASRGSAHGYDVVDHRRVNPELGGDAAHARMGRALAEHGLGQLLDIVPNHMAIGTPDNQWWWDVLENGPASRWAGHFDVDWRNTEDDRVLLPILGERYADALAGPIRVARDGARFLVRYHDHELPVAPRSLGEPLGRAASRAGSTALAFLADALANLPAPTATDLDSIDRRHRDRQVIDAILGRLLDEIPEIAAAIDAELAAIAEDPSRLDAFLERQNWRLGFWRYALGELKYRRFFDVATLAGLRVEDPRVFEDVHQRILGWLADGTLDGVRIDHVDGLRDPTGYLERLRERAPRAWIVVEKILAPGETTPAPWPIDGTTGYELIRVLDGVLVDPAGREPLEAVWASFGGDVRPWEEQAREARLAVIDQLLATERDRLVALAVQLVAHRPMLRDVTERELAAAITELLASFPVYRTYARPGTVASEADRRAVDLAIAAATRHRPEVDRRVWDALRGALLLEQVTPPAIELALRLQQTSGAVMAKGIEDTLFYRNAQLVALDEVGGAPERFGVSLDELHAALAATPPRSLVATATHDTKRGEDVRARLLVLSEIPDEWAGAVRRWSERAAPCRRGDLPDRPFEYFVWQTLVGAWPVSAERARAYLEKAAREAKRRTSWLAPDEAYEQAIAAFVTGVLADDALARDIAAFVASIQPAAWRNVLTRTLLKLTARGVPDLYQGTELWDGSLVDPDNRRPVDFALRRELLRRVRDLGPEAALAELDAGLPKLWLIQRVLHARRRDPASFDGDHRRLDVRGPDEARVIAFARGDRLVALAPRWTARAPDWKGTTVTLPPGPWRDVLTGERVPDGPLPVARAWARFPVALLARAP